MTSENLFYSNGNLKIIDWENSSLEAPIFVDLLCYLISINFRALNRNPVTLSVRNLYNDLPLCSDIDIFFALAYLAFITESKEALKLFSNLIE